MMNYTLNSHLEKIGTFLIIFDHQAIILLLKKGITMSSSQLNSEETFSHKNDRFYSAVLISVFQTKERAKKLGGNFKIHNFSSIGGGKTTYFVSIGT